MMMNPLARHSGAGRNPAETNTPQSGQNDVAPLSREIFNQLDSGLRRNDKVLVNERSGMKSKLGFTMIEMAIVLIMIGILTASLAPLLLRQHTNSMEGRDRVALEDAKTAIINYAISFGGIPGAVLLNGVSGAMPNVSAFGVNNWGAFGDGTTNPFRLDVNDYLTVSGVQNLGGTTGGDKVVFCQAVNALMKNGAASPNVCQDYASPANDHVTTVCANSVPAAFVLYSTGNDRKANMENDETGALGANRIYENDKRGINNSNDGTSHYDDQVMSYPLSALARDCREKMNVAPEVMNCAAGYKYVGSITNNYSTSISFGIDANTIPSAASSVPGNGFVLYVNSCYPRTYNSNFAVASNIVSAVSALDTNSDGRVDIFISTASAVTAQ